jgi:hypothetical protein
MLLMCDLELHNRLGVMINCSCGFGLEQLETLIDCVVVELRL